MVFLPLRWVVTLCALSFSSAATADSISCAFVTECLETETCAATSYDITLSHKTFAHPQDGMDASAVWQDDAVTRTVLLRSRPDVMFAMWAENDARQFGRLVADAAGNARYVVMDVSGPLIITYHGTCKDAE